MDAENEAPITLANAGEEGKVKILHNLLLVLPL